MRITLITAAVAAAAATLTACASSETGSGRSAGPRDTGIATSSAASAATSRSVDTSSSPAAASADGNGVAVGEPAPGSADSSLARFGVRRAELPGDFAVTAAAKSGLPSARHDDALQRCTGSSVVSRKRAAGASSATFGSPYATVRSTTERFATQQDVTDAVAALGSSDAEKCFGAWFASQRAALTGVDDSTPRSSSVEVRPGTNDGPTNAAGVASAQYEYRGNSGAGYPVSVAVYYLTGPKLLTRLTVTKSGGDAFDGSLNGVLFPVAARTAAG